MKNKTNKTKTNKTNQTKNTSTNTTKTPNCAKGSSEDFNCKAIKGCRWESAYPNAPGHLGKCVAAKTDVKKNTTKNATNKTNKTN